MTSSDCRSNLKEYGTVSTTGLFSVGPFLRHATHVVPSWHMDRPHKRKPDGVVGVRRPHGKPTCGTHRTSVHWVSSFCTHQKEKIPTEQPFAHQRRGSVCYRTIEDYLSSTHTHTTTQPHNQAKGVHMTGNLVPFRLYASHPVLHVLRWAVEPADLKTGKTHNNTHVCVWYVCFPEHGSQRASVILDSRRPRLTRRTPMRPAPCDENTRSFACMGCARRGQCECRR